MAWELVLADDAKKIDSFLAAMKPSGDFYARMTPEYVSDKISRMGWEAWVDEAIPMGIFLRYCLIQNICKFLMGGMPVGADNAEMWKRFCIVAEDFAHRHGGAPLTVSVPKAGCLPYMFDFYTHVLSSGWVQIGDSDRAKKHQIPHEAIRQIAEAEIK